MYYVPQADTNMQLKQLDRMHSIAVNVRTQSEECQYSNRSSEMPPIIAHFKHALARHLYYEHVKNLHLYIRCTKKLGGYVRKSVLVRKRQ